jgi:acetate kinase
VSGSIKRLGQPGTFRVALAEHPSKHPAIQVIEAFRASFGYALPMVAMYDTAFHRMMPRYALGYTFPSNLVTRDDAR